MFGFSLKFLSGNPTAETANCQKYNDLLKNYHFQPVAIETIHAYVKSTIPFLSNLAKKFLMSGDPREWQWFPQHLSLVMVRGNPASILACVQVISDFSCSQGTDQYYHPPLAFTSMHSYCLPNVCAFFKFCCPFVMLLRLLTNYFDHHIAYDTTASWYVPL